MKSKSIISSLFMFAIAVVLLGANSLFAAQGAQLIVKRAANFGERVSLAVSIDGKEVARLTEGRTYDGSLPAGRHIISATVTPNLVNSPVWQKEITVQSGQTYSFTAIWQGQRMVLANN